MSALQRRTTGFFVFLQAAVVCSVIFLVSQGFAQDVDQLEKVVSSGICPGDLSTYSIVDANARCDPEERNTKACDRQYEAPSKEWQACYEQVFQCRREVDEINKKIYAYNAFIYKCRVAFPERPKRQFSPQAARAQSGSAANAPSSADIEAAKKKADEAREKARKAAADAAQKRSEEEAEKQRLKETATKVPSFCQGMIRACKERNASLANLTAATQSDCRSYCEKLEIENCNPSSTIQGAAQACSAGAERDQKEAAKREAERRQAEAQRREAENYIPPGWIRCPCPADDMYLIPLGRAKLVNGVLYHPRDVGPCGGR